MSLCTIEQIYEYLQQDYNPSVADAATLLLNSLYDSLILSVTAWIENTCNRTFESASYTEYVDGYGTQIIVMGQYPITSLTSVNTVDNREVVSSTIDVGEVRIDLNPGMLFHGGGFPTGYKNIKVVYTAGYAADSIPEDLNLLCIQTIVSIVDKSTKDSSVVEEKQGDYSYKIKDTIEKNKEANQILALYRNVV